MAAGSNLINGKTVYYIRGCSSVGRAPALQAGGHEFESHHLHSEARKCDRRTYLDNFTLIKIIKETYVDLIVTDIRFYRMNKFCNEFIYSIENQFKQQSESEKSDLSSNLFNKFLRTRKTSVTLYRRTAKTVYRSSK